MKKLCSFLLTVLIISCTKKTEANLDLEPIKKEVLKTEDNFKKLSQTKGIGEAFYNYADNNAVLIRENDSLIKGKENIKKYYTNDKFKNATVTWKPDFVAVSNDGSLAYTYGSYVYNVKDYLGNKREFKGVFHTIWKKQKDGSWKYVWD